jgi:hypothetical protein
MARSLVLLLPFLLSVSLSYSASDDRNNENNSLRNLGPRATDQFQPALPFSTRGSDIIDARGVPQKLISVNIPGANDRAHVIYGLDRISIDEYARLVKEAGFNSVRMLFSNEMMKINTPVPTRFITENLEGPRNMANQNPLQIFKKSVEAFTDAGLMVILNNHSTDSYWCCSVDDGNEFWDSGQTTEEWIRDWETMAHLFHTNPYVIGADLRNELRAVVKEGRYPNWAGHVNEEEGLRFPYDPKNDWRIVAAQAADRLFKIRPDWLMVIGGLQFSNDLRGVRKAPLELTVPHKLVYSPHAYGFQKKTDYHDYWAFIVEDNKPYTAPLWLGEFGNGPVADEWWNSLIQLVREKNISVAYWSMNAERFPNEQGVFEYQEESYGILKKRVSAAGKVYWDLDLNDYRIKDIQSLK